MKNEEGISSVLGAVLMFGLLMMTLVMVQVQFAPVWEEEREARHTDLVGNQIGFLKSELDRQAVEGSNSPVTTHIDLRTEGGFTFFNSNKLGGTASFVSNTGEVVFEAPQITIQDQDGTSLLGVEEVWETIQDGVEVGPADELLHLRVRVPNPHGDPSGIKAILTIKDADDNYAGMIELRNGNDAMYVSTFSKDSTTVPITNRLDDTDPDGPTFYFNLLDDNLLFDSVVAAAKKPITLELDDQGLPADFTVVYDRITESGKERVGADIGVTILDYNFSTPAGSLTVDLANANYVDQTYVIEHGAIILAQSDGAAMIAPPSLVVSSGNVQHRIQWTVPTMQGSTASVGTAQASATVSPQPGGVTLSALMPSFSLTVPTAYPGVWASYWQETLEAQGFDLAAGEFGITLTTTSAKLSVWGPLTNPASTTNDVVVDLQQQVLGVVLTPF